MKKRNDVGLLMAFMITMGMKAQIESPMDIQIGKPLPEVVLKDLQYYPKDEVNTKDLMGTPYVLKFWSRLCGSSIKYLSKADKLLKEFEGQIKIFVVAGRGAPYREGQTPGQERKALEDLFERIRTLQGLELPITYDLDLFKKVVPRGVPHLILVDKNGIVKAVTTELNAEIISSFLHGEDLPLKDYSKRGVLREEERIDTYDYNQFFMVDHNGGRNDSFEFRSILTPYTDDMPMGKMLPVHIEQYDYWKKIEGFGGLNELYKLAYLGKYNDILKALYWEKYPMPVLELGNTQPFKDVRLNRPLCNAYWYSLVVPKRLGDKASLMATMQHDLEDFFGYQAKMERRELPYWKITLPKEARRQLRSKGGEPNIESDYYTRIGVTNLPVGQFLHKILYMISPYGYKGIPLLDQTGGGLNVDIPVQDVDFFDFMAIKEILETLGFQIEKTFGEFDALVIRDSKYDPEKE